MQNEDKKYCYRYPHPAVTTDCVIFTFHERALKVLLIRRGIEPYKGMWALPGGFMRIDESAEEGAIRELLEETGYRAAYIRQFHTFSAPGRDPRERVVTIAFFALVRWARVRGGDDAAEACWTPVNSVPQLAFDHSEILRMALDSLRRDIHFDPVGFELLGEKFSMRELQEVYEAILGREFDRRNFAKKMQHTGIIEAADPRETRMPDDSCRSQAPSTPGNKCASAQSPQKQSRISKLFRFNRSRYDKLKKNDNVEF